MTNERHLVSLRDGVCSSYFSFISSSCLSVCSALSFPVFSKFIFIFPGVLVDFTGTTVTSSESSPSCPKRYLFNFHKVDFSLISY